MQNSLLPFIGALAGWLLFRGLLALWFVPRRAWGFGPFKLQGWLPARRTTLEPTTLALFDPCQMNQNVIGSRSEAELALVFARRADCLIHLLIEEFPPWLLQLLRKRRVLLRLEQALVAEQLEIFRELPQTPPLDSDSPASSTMNEHYPDEFIRFEQLLRKSAETEMRIFRALGATFGLLIGLLQSGLLQL